MTPSPAALRSAIVDAKRTRNQAMVDNAAADDAGAPRPHTDADLEAMRLAVDLAAFEARDAGVGIDDLVGPNVGWLEQ